MVGFQTKLRHGEQKRIFRTIPGLEHAEFARLGGLHRNTFINSPRLLDSRLRLKAMPRLRFAGQITGVEGYVESAAIGLLAGRFRRRRASWARHRPSPADYRARRAAAPHHRRGRYGELSADERQFRTVPAAFARSRPPCRPEAAAGVARSRRSRRLAQGHRAGKVTPLVSFRGRRTAASPESMNTGLWNMDSGFPRYAQAPE